MISRETTRVIVVSELYYPEETSTGHVMTTIAEGLAETFPTTAICAQPSYSLRGDKAAKRERRNGVDIVRVRSTSLDPHSLPLKLINYATVSLSCFLTTLRTLRRGDHVFVVTNPPLLPFLVVLAARLRGATSSVVIHDLYPDVLVPAGLAKAESRLLGLLNLGANQLFRAADNIVVVGRDQAERIGQRLKPAARDKIKFVRQSADLDTIGHHSKADNPHLIRLGLDDPETVIIQFAGNIGPLQNIDSLVEAISKTSHIKNVHFLFFGDGRKRKYLGEEIQARGLSNVTVQDPVARAEADVMHAASDVALISLTKGMKGISVPSRIGNALASGRPILAVIEQGSELEQLISENGSGGNGSGGNGIGWWCEPESIDGFVAAVEAIASCGPSRLSQMQHRARGLAEEQFDVEQMTEGYVQVVEPSQNLIEAK